MRVKALKTFVSGQISGVRDEIINIPQYKVGKLSRIGFIETIEESVEPIKKVTSKGGRKTAKK